MGGRVDFEGQAEDIQHILNRLLMKNYLQMFDQVKRPKREVRAPRNSSIRNYHP